MSQRLEIVEVDDSLHLSSHKLHFMKELVKLSEVLSFCRQEHHSFLSNRIKAYCCVDAHFLLVKLLHLVQDEVG